MTTILATPAPLLTAPDRPSLDEIDLLAAQYRAAKAAKAAAQESYEEIEETLVNLVQVYGFVPANAEKSRRLNGRVAELTITKADILTINEDRVETLREALEANGFGDYFGKLFAKRTKYEVVEGAESALKAESLPKRLSERVLQLWGRCISVRAKKPSLRVVIAEPTAAKRSRKAVKA